MGEKDTRIHFNDVVATRNLLEAMRRNHVKQMAFTSTAAVYGEMKRPATEDQGPLLPASQYGASKLACEGLISSYCFTFGFQAWIFRLANIIGPNSTHGVVYDFVAKLKRNPSTLTVLGDGSQQRTFLLVNDCVEAMLLVVERTDETVNVFNIGSNDLINIKEVAEIVFEEMHVKPKVSFAGGIRGWKGDLQIIHLQSTKARAIEWTPAHDSREAVRRTITGLNSERVKCIVR